MFVIDKRFNISWPIFYNYWSEFIVSESEAVSTEKESILIYCLLLLGNLLHNKIELILLKWFKVNFGTIFLGTKYLIIFY